jgi:hypothetical protein
MFIIILLAQHFTYNIIFKHFQDNKGDIAQKSLNFVDIQFITINSFKKMLLPMRLWFLKIFFPS